MNCIIKRSQWPCEALGGDARHLSPHLGDTCAAAPHGPRALRSTHHGRACRGLLPCLVRPGPTAVQPRMLSVSLVALPAAEGRVFTRRVALFGLSSRGMYRGRGPAVPQERMGIPPDGGALVSRHGRRRSAGGRPGGGRRQEATGAGGRAGAAEGGGLLSRLRDPAPAKHEGREQGWGRERPGGGIVGKRNQRAAGTGVGQGPKSEETSAGRGAWWALTRGRFLSHAPKGGLLS
jgi:hypothetical protein